MFTAGRIAGRLIAASLPLYASFSMSNCENLVSFSPKEFRSFPVTEVHSISHNTKILKIALPSADHEMGAKTASCIMVKGNNGPDGKPLMRPYTPITLNSQRGYFELLIKSYPDGNVSKYLHALHPGDSVEVKGPFPKIEYKPNMKKNIGMIAGGTGLTPMLQIIMEVINNPEDKTELTLVFANNSEEDILMKDTLDDIAKKHSNFKVIYVVSQPKSSTYSGYRGFVNADLVKKYMPSPSADSMVFVCGPPPMMKAISGPKTPDLKQGMVEGMLKDLHYTEDMVYKF